MIFPIKNGGSFHSYVAVYQRVTKNGDLKWIVFADGEIFNGGWNLKTCRCWFCPTNHRHFDRGFFSLCMPWNSKFLTPDFSYFFCCNVVQSCLMSVFDVKKSPCLMVILGCFKFVCGCRNAHLRIPEAIQVKSRSPMLIQAMLILEYAQKRIFQLVGGGQPSPLKKYEFVSWDDDMTPIYGKTCSKHFQTTNQPNNDGWWKILHGYPDQLWSWKLQMWIGQCLNVDSKCQDLHFQASNAFLNLGGRALIGQWKWWYHHVSLEKWIVQQPEMGLSENRVYSQL